MREFRLEHVEADFAGLAVVALRRDELEAGVRVDEAADQPGAGDAVDMNAAARDPGFVLQVGGALLRHVDLLLLRGQWLREPGLDVGQKPFDRQSAGRAEKIDFADLREPAPQLDDLELELRVLAASAAAFQSGRQDAQLLGELPVIGVTRAVEQAAHLLVAQAIDQTGFADHALAAAVLDLAQEPLEILARLLAGRQHVDRILDRHGAKALQPAPDLDPQIGWFGRQLMDQQQPGGGTGRRWDLGLGSARH